MITEIKWRIEAASNGFILYIVSIDDNDADRKERASRKLFLNKDSLLRYLEDAIPDAQA